MTKLEILIGLNTLLLDDMPQFQKQAKHFPPEILSQWKLFRSLVNVREPSPISDDFLKIQDNFLQNEIAEKGITEFAALLPIRDNFYLWQGDITTLRVDAIVNAANSGMTGCYCPCHGCIDNAIHTFSGIQLRNACAEIISRQGFSEPIGQAKITGAYNLPSKYIIHTVGPTVNGKLARNHKIQLASCYRSCLQLAEENQLNSIAFCCISTGEFHFPIKEAASIAVQEVTHYQAHGGKCKVVFNVFNKKNWQIYNQLLSK